MTDMRSSSSGAGSSGHSFGTRAVTAMFDSRSDAEDAVDALIEAGFSRSDVRLVPGHEKDADTGDSLTGSTGSGSSTMGSSTSGYTSGSDTSYRGHEEGRGFWESLSDFFFPDEDRYSYAEGLRRGGYLVTVNTTESNHDQAVDILDDEGTIDLDEREDEWRTQGWGGYSGSSDTGAGSMGSTSTTTPGVGYTGVGTSGSSGSAMDTSSAGSTRLGSGTGTGMGSPNAGTIGSDDTGAAESSGGYGRSSIPDAGEGAGTTGLGSSSGLGSTQRDRSGMDKSGDWATSRGADRESEEVIPLAEERLNVGKREVGGGRVRVRSYVVERPVEEQVSLRREHVDVQRRPVDRAMGAGEDAFRERTVEMNERSEQPVVSKDARIREEVSLRKNVDTQNQTISDTVRRTEVEVEDERSKSDDASRRRS